MIRHLSNTSNFETLESEGIDKEMPFDPDGEYDQVKDIVETGKMLPADYPDENPPTCRHGRRH